MDMPTPGARTETEPAPPTEATNDRPPRSSRLPSVIVVVVAIAIAALSVWYLLRGEPLLVQGEVDATRFDIAARVDGRVGEIPVARGENVAANAVLVRIDNPETSPSTNRRWRPRSSPMRSLQTSTPALAVR